MIHSILSVLMRMTGFNALADMSAAGIATLAVTSVLTMVWLIGLSKKVRRGMGIFGGPAMAAFTLSIGVGLVLGITSMLSSLATGMIAGAIGNIPVIGPPLARPASWLLGAAFNFALAIGFGIYILKNIRHLSSSMMHTVMKPFQQGHNTSHLLMGALATTFIINSPSFNAQNYFIPAILSACLGLYTLIGVRPKWREIEWSTKKEYVKTYGELPYGRKLETEEDAQLMRESIEEMEAVLRGDDLRDKIEQACKVKVRIARQLELFESERDQSPRTEDEAVAHKMAELEAQLEAEAEAEADEEGHRARLH